MRPGQPVRRGELASGDGRDRCHQHRVSEQASEREKLNHERPDAQLQAEAKGLPVSST